MCSQPGRSYDDVMVSSDGCGQNGQACMCCGSDALRAFMAPAWCDGGWSDVSVGECQRCGSLSTQGPGSSVPAPSRWPVLFNGDIRATLLAASRNGRGVLSVPLAQGPVWDEYRDNWMAVSPSGHRWIPTVDGLRLVAQSAGLVIESVHGSCPVDHFILSELIARRIPQDVEPGLLFSSRELSHLERKTRRCGDASRCPEATIVFRKGAAL